MKNEAEIRRHRDDLVVAMQMPCGCQGTEHVARCMVGLKMMKAVSETLSWVLGENDPQQRLVDEMRSDVAEFTAHRNN